MNNNLLSRIGTKLRASQSRHAQNQARLEKQRIKRDNITVLKAEPELKPDKGEFNGSCNRTACQASGATWYNHSTRKYYCASCAGDINYWAERDHLYSFEHGHQLCTFGEHGLG